jgi:hypothetical protein
MPYLWICLALFAVLSWSCVSSERESEPAEVSGVGNARTVNVTLLSQTQEKAARPLIQESREIFSNTKEATYSHKINVSEDKGAYHFDCSGFVTFALEKGTPKAAQELEKGVKSLAEQEGKKTPKRPLAKHFVGFFEALEEGKWKAQAWQPVKRVSELEPGDVLAWLMPAEIESRNTGHVMIVREKPKPHPLHPNEWIVPIVDSTSRPHGPTDSRAASKTTGLGVGEVVVVADERGMPNGYRWSPNSKKKRSTEVGMARPESGAQKF